MTALTADAKLWEIGVPNTYPKLSFPVAINQTIYGNSIAWVNSSGQLANPSAPTNGVVRGLVDRGIVTTTPACAFSMDVNQGIFAVPYCSNDGFSQADVGTGALAYLYDNITVTKTAGSLIAAGKVVAVSGIGQGVGLPAGYVAVAFGLVGGVT
jgi:predicted RecA/RadA family phage recombinase